MSIGNQYACASINFENASHLARFTQFIDQIQHHKCMPANNSSITSRYQFILNCVFPTRLCASGDVDVLRSNEQCITCCYDYVVPTIACHCGHAIAT